MSINFLINQIFKMFFLVILSKTGCLLHLMVLSIVITSCEIVVVFCKGKSALYLKTRLHLIYSRNKLQDDKIDKNKVNRLRVFVLGM